MAAISAPVRIQSQHGQTRLKSGPQTRLPAPPMKRNENRDHRPPETVGIRFGAEKRLRPNSVEAVHVHFQQDGARHRPRQRDRKFSPPGYEESRDGNHECRTEEGDRAENRNFLSKFC